jgi:hypothetical protein
VALPTDVVRHLMLLPHCLPALHSPHQTPVAGHGGAIEARSGARGFFTSIPRFDRPIPTSTAYCLLPSTLDTRHSTPPNELFFGRPPANLLYSAPGVRDTARTIVTVGPRRVVGLAREVESNCGLRFVC